MQLLCVVLQAGTGWLCHQWGKGQWWRNLPGAAAHTDSVARKAGATCPRGQGQQPQADPPGHWGRCWEAQDGKGLCGVSREPSEPTLSWTDPARGTRWSGVEAVERAWKGAWWPVGHDEQVLWAVWTGAWAPGGMGKQVPVLQSQSLGRGVSVAGAARAQLSPAARQGLQSHVAGLESHSLPRPQPT